MTDRRGPFEVPQARISASLRDHVGQAGFPCVGAKSALAGGRLEIVTAWLLTSAWNDIAIHQRLMDWSEEYRGEPTGLRSLAVVFSGPTDLDEQHFEEAMWNRLQSLAAKDGWLGQRHDPAVSSDPEEPHFSLSFGNQAYFVVGMHPNASRTARRIEFPVLVFNLHDQFERLRASERYERMREVIIRRDAALDGSPNPMLVRFGTVSEARQYSGRQVGLGWKCPYSDPRAP